MDALLTAGALAAGEALRRTEHPWASAACFAEAGRRLVVRVVRSRRIAVEGKGRRVVVTGAASCVEVPPVSFA